MERAYREWTAVQNAPPPPRARADSRRPWGPAGRGAIRPRTPGPDPDDAPPARRARTAQEGAADPEVPDSDDPVRIALIQRIQALREPEKSRWRQHARRRIPIAGGGVKFDPSLHTNETLAAFLATLR